MKDTLIYPVADTLSLSLNEMQGEVVRGAGTRSLTMAGMKFEADMVVVSDYIGQDSAGYFVRMHANIWAYMVVTNAQSVRPDTAMLVFDSKIVDLRVKDAVEFGCKDIQATISKLKPAIRSVFEFKAATNKWVQVDVSDLEFVPEEQST